MGWLQEERRRGGLAGKGLARAGWPCRGGYFTAHRGTNHPTRPRISGLVTEEGGQERWADTHLGSSE